MINSEEILDELLALILDCTVIVEGKKDAQALEALGVDPENIVVLNKGQSLLATVEALSGDDNVAILTDMDKEGKHLYKKLLSMFSQYGIKENPRPRELFAQLRLSHVEGL